MENTIIYPCAGCTHYKTCGDFTRTEPCPKRCVDDTSSINKVTRNKTNKEEE